MLHTYPATAPARRGVGRDAIAKGIVHHERHAASPILSPGLVALVAVGLDTSALTAAVVRAVNRACQAPCGPQLGSGFPRAWWRLTDMLPTDLWPLAGLRVRTPRLTLRVPDEGQLVELARLAAAGVHPPEVMPFTVPWTDVSPRERGRSTVRHQWDGWAGLRPDDWRLGLVCCSMASWWVFRTSLPISSRCCGRSQPGRGSGSTIRGKASARR